MNLHLNALLCARVRSVSPHAPLAVWPHQWTKKCKPAPYIYFIQESKPNHCIPGVCVGSGAGGRKGGGGVRVCVYMCVCM